VTFTIDFEIGFEDHVKQPPWTFLQRLFVKEVSRARTLAS